MTLRLNRRHVQMYRFQAATNELQSLKASVQLSSTWFVCSPEGCVKLPSLPEGEITAIEVHRANPYVELGISIVGGNETPLINIVIQEVYRDGVIARDGRLLAGDQILQVAGKCFIQKLHWQLVFSAAVI